MRISWLPRKSAVSLPVSPPLPDSNPVYRTHTCGELRREHSGQTVTLAGWVHSYREQGRELVFVDLRDRYGKTQVVFNTDDDAKIDSLARKLRREDVIRVTGEVRYRGDGMTNPRLATGEIELRVKQLTLLSRSKTPPLKLRAENSPTKNCGSSIAFWTSVAPNSSAVCSCGTSSPRPLASTSIR